jgi:DNA-binding transcriptional MocR family regulator
VKEKKSINFLRGVPSEEALSCLIPFASEGYAEIIRHYGTEVLQYGHFTGFTVLRELIGRLHDVNPQRVIVGNGGLEVISLFFKSLPRKSLILVEETSYDRVLIDALNYGHDLMGVKLTREGVDVDHFKELVTQKAPTVFYGIPYHQNPTGINYTQDNRKAVERICRQNNMHCVWDVCYQDLRYDGNVNDPIEVSDRGPVLASSFTKTISPGTKCGYIIVPNRYVEHFSGIIANTRINPNLPTQAFIADFIQSGKYADHLKFLCELYRPKMEALNAAIKDHFPGAFPVDISGGFFAPLMLTHVSVDNESAFVQSVKEAGVGIAPAWNAVAPNLKKEMQQKGIFIRLTFPAYQPDEIKWGVSTLKETTELFR